MPVTDAPREFVELFEALPGARTALFDSHLWIEARMREGMPPPRHPALSQTAGLDEHGGVRIFADPDVVDRVVVERRRLLENTRARELRRTVSVVGRLGVFWTDNTVSEGATAAASDGFFDVHDCPPWDLWLGELPCRWINHAPQPALVFWVPPPFERALREGIGVSSTACLAFLGPGLTTLWPDAPSHL